MFIHLASQSPRRKEILKQMRVPFRVVRSRYIEEKGIGCSNLSPSAMGHLKPHELVMHHAIGKARKAVLPKSARYVLGSDTIVWAGGHKLGKPRNRKDAIRMLKLISGKRHEVFSAIAIWDRKTGWMFASYDKTEVFIKKLSLSEIESYIDKIHAWDKAGAYAIQERPKIVKKIKGSYSNVAGFPKKVFGSLLLALGLKKAKSQQLRAF